MDTSQRWKNDLCLSYPLAWTQANGVKSTGACRFDSSRGVFHNDALLRF